MPILKYDDDDQHIAPALLPAALQNLKGIWKEQGASEAEIQALSLKWLASHGDAETYNETTAPEPTATPPPKFVGDNLANYKGDLPKVFGPELEPGFSEASGEIQGPEYPFSNRAPREINRFMSESVPGALSTFAGMAGPVAEGLSELMPEPGSIASVRIRPEMAPPPVGPGAASAEMPPPPRGGMAGALGVQNSTRAPVWNPTLAGAESFGEGQSIPVEMPPEMTGAPPGAVEEYPMDAPMPMGPPGSEMGPPEIEGSFGGEPAGEEPPPEVVQALAPLLLKSQEEEPKGRGGLFGGLFDMGPSERQAMLALGLGLMGGEARGGNLAQIAARAGMGAMQVYNQAEATQQAYDYKKDRLELEMEKVNQIRDWRQAQIEQGKANEKGRGDRQTKSLAQQAAEKRADRQGQWDRLMEKNRAMMERAKAKARSEKGKDKWTDADYLQAQRHVEEMIEIYGTLNPRIATTLQQVRALVSGPNRAPGMNATIFHNRLEQAITPTAKESESQLQPDFKTVKSPLGTQDMVQQRYKQIREQNPSIDPAQALQMAEEEFIHIAPAPIEKENDEEEE